MAASQVDEAIYPPFPNLPDPIGDVVFEVGDEGNFKYMRVSSKVLGQASPVFKAMVSDKWNKRNSEMATFVKICLPDDHADAMLVSSA